MARYGLNKLGDVMMALVVKTNVAAAVKEISARKGSDVNSISEDFLPSLEEKVKKLIEDAVYRANSNNRRTVMGRDL